MKEPEKHGDVSPLSGSLSNLAENPLPEPTFERLANFSRVTPAQMIHVTFPRDGRYHPVRPVSTFHGSHKSVTGIITTAERYAGGGGILILHDHRPSETPEYYEFTTQPATPAAEEVAEAPRVPHIALDEDAPEVGPPEPFEVSSGSTLVATGRLLIRGTLFSIRSRATRSSVNVVYFAVDPSQC